MGVECGRLEVEAVLGNGIYDDMPDACLMFA
jgi:hypothetical protein